MTQNDFIRAQLAAFCIREAGPDAPLEHMKAIALVMRNRVRQGWHGGDWLENIDRAAEYSAHGPGPRALLDLKNRNQSRLVREIDEIFFSRPTDDFEKGTKAARRSASRMLWARALTGPSLIERSPPGLRFRFSIARRTTGRGHRSAL